MSVLGMTLNCIWRWGPNLGAKENVEYLFIAITLRSILAQRGDPIYGSNWTGQSFTKDYNYQLFETIRQYANYSYPIGILDK